MWLLLIFCFAVAWAILRGLERGGQSVARSYRDGRAKATARRAARRKLTSDALDLGVGEGTRKGAATTAAAVGATVTASRVHLKALLKGLAEGWKEGRKRAVDLRDHTVDYVPDETVRTVKDPDPPATHGSVIDADQPTCIWLIPGPGTSPGTTCGEPATKGRYCDAHAILADIGHCLWGDGNPDVPICTKPRAGNTPWCIDHGNEFRSRTTTPPATPADTATPTGDTPVNDTVRTRIGEVTNYDQLMEALKTIHAEAAAELDNATGDRDRAVEELEDAQADVHFAKQDIADVDAMIGSLGALKLDPASIGEVTGIGETNATRLSLATARTDAADQRMKLADQRVAAADARMAAAATAQANITARHQNIKEAVDSAPVSAADGAFYGA